MFKKVLLLVLVSLLVDVNGAIPAYNSSKEDKDSNLAEEVKERIRGLGTGSAAHAEVKLRDKTCVKGFIKEVEEHSFVLVDLKTGVATTPPSSQVKQVKDKSFSAGPAAGNAAGHGETGRSRAREASQDYPCRWGISGI
jgi:hypothetical protein